MSEQTLLDQAHAAMEAYPENDAARLRFFERLADAELFLLLAAEAQSDAITPELFEFEGAHYVLAFDREERLSAFTGSASPYAALSGRGLAALLVENGLGLGLNLDVAPSSFLLPQDGVAWLADALAQRPEELEQRVSEVSAPRQLPEDLLLAIDTKLTSAVGLAASAYLVGVAYETGARGHMLAFIDPEPGAEPALARAVSEVLQFSGLEAAALDVAFFTSTDPMAAMLAKQGLRFDLPQAKPQTVTTRAAPGTDPDTPPILR
jgi:hypothetical protein